MPETSALDADTIELVSDPFPGPTDASMARPQPRRRGAAGQSQSRACPGVFLSVHTDLEALEAEWRAFEAAADCTAFQCFDWAAKWQRHIGARKGVRPAIVLGRSADGTLLFILPLAVERRRLVRRLGWLAAELCDYNGPMLSRGFAESVRPDRFLSLWGEILLLLRTDPKLGFDLIDLSRMLAKVGAQQNPFMGLGPTLDPSGAHLANLSDSWEAFYASKRSSATRKRERRQFRHLAEFGEVQFVEPSTPDDIERTLDELFAQKAASFTRMGVEDFLKRPGHREFFRDIATDPDAEAFTHVSRLDVGPTMAGTSFGLEFRGRYYLLLSSYQQGSELSRFGPGRAHLQELIRRAIEKGLAQFDFTVGDEAYKRDWSDVTMPLYGYLAVTTPMGVPAVMSTIAFRRAKRTIKQNPFLWRIFNEARQRMAAWTRRPGQVDTRATSED